MLPQKIFEKKDALRRILVHSKLNFLPYPYPRKHNLSHKFVHVHKDIVDELNLKEIAVEFVSVNDERRKHFGNY